MTSMNFQDCFDNQQSYFNQKYLKLNEKLFEVIENFNLVQYTTSNIQDEESIQNLILHIDNLVQYDEYKMPKDTNFLDNQEAPDE